MSTIQHIGNLQWRSGMIKGMWNANNPNDPEFPSSEDSDWQTLQGYNYGYSQPQKAKQLLSEYSEAQEWV